ncbi:MAG TPA: hypothetical protein VF756_25535 [Thermoanaerobaculia bacterium]
MKRTAHCLIGILLCAAPLSAQPQLSRRTDVPAALASAAAQDPTLAEAVASRPLFFALPADQLVQEGQELEFRVLLNGQLHIQETLPLEPSSAPGSAFELLATRPDLRDRLYDLSGDRANQLQVQVLLGGKAIGDFSFADFVRYNREIKGKKFAPRHAASQVLDLTAGDTTPQSATPRGIRSVTAAGTGPDPACVQQCDEEYAWNVNTYGCDYGDCSRWESERQACLQRCPIVCIDPKRVTEPTYTEVVARYWGPSDCYEHWWESDFFMGEWYRYTETQYKHTKVRRTEYCDGHVEEQVLQVWYSYSACWARSGLSCYYPWDRMYYACY